MTKDLKDDAKRVLKGKEEKKEKRNEKNSFVRSLISFVGGVCLGVWQVRIC